MELYEEFNNPRGKIFLDLVCNGCKMTFSRNKNEHNNHLKQGCENTYCSNDCQIKYTKKTLTEVNCRFCNEIILKPAAYIKKKFPNLFCNSSCFAKWNNKNRKRNI